MTKTIPRGNQARSPGPWPLAPPLPPAVTTPLFLAPRAWLGGSDHLFAAGSRPHLHNLPATALVCGPGEAHMAPRPLRAEWLLVLDMTAHPLKRWSACGRPPLSPFHNAVKSHPQGHPPHTPCSPPPAPDFLSQTDWKSQIILLHPSIPVLYFWSQYSLSIGA